MQLWAIYVYTKYCRLFHIYTYNIHIYFYSQQKTSWVVSIFQNNSMSAALLGMPSELPTPTLQHNVAETATRTCHPPPITWAHDSTRQHTRTWLSNTFHMQLVWNTYIYILHICCCLVMINEKPHTGNKIMIILFAAHFEFAQFALKTLHCLKLWGAKIVQENQLIGRCPQVDTDNPGRHAETPMQRSPVNGPSFQSRLTPNLAEH